MIRIYADFNSTDEDQKVVLNTNGSLADIRRHAAELTEGLRVTLYMTDEFEVEGTIELDRASQVWLGIPDWDTLRRYPTVNS